MGEGALDPTPQGVIQVSPELLVRVAPGRPDAHRLPPIRGLPWGPPSVLGCVEKYTRVHTPGPVSLSVTFELNQSLEGKEAPRHGEGSQPFEIQELVSKSHSLPSRQWPSRPVLTPAQTQPEGAPPPPPPPHFTAGGAGLKPTWPWVIIPGFCPLH